MNKKLNLSIIFVIFVNELTYSYAQGLKDCKSNEECILTSQCQSMVALLRTNTQDNLRKVREAICQFQGRRSLVCCPRSSPVETPPSENPFIIDTPNSQLPTRCGKPGTDDRIIGGSPAPIGAYPWMAAMGYIGRKSDIKYLCSGSLINSRYVLTAAHCVDSEAQRERKLSVISLGDWDLSRERDCEITVNGREKCAKKSITAGIESITIHPDYNTRAVSSDDIALVRLNFSIDFNSIDADIEPVCLPAPSFNVRSAAANNREAVAAGWGLTEHGNSSDILLRVNVPFANDELCKRRYSTQFLSDQLCIGGKGGSDTCSGDSGGPLVIPGEQGPPFYQIGIVSYGTFPCGLNTIPGVYTSVSEYYDWIIKNLKP